MTFDQPAEQCHNQQTIRYSYHLTVFSDYANQLIIQSITVFEV